jgi:hypothetical protein
MAQQWGRQNSRGVATENAEQGTPGGDPPEGLLQHRHSQATADQITRDQGDESAIIGEIGAKQDRGRAGPATGSEYRLQQGGLNMKDADGASSNSDRGDRGGDPVGIGRSCQMTDLAPRRDAGSRQVDNQALLQSTGRLRGDQGRPGRPAAQVHEQRCAVDVGGSAGKGRSGGSRPFGTSDRGDQNGRGIIGALEPHRTVLAAAELLTARCSATAESGEGGRSLTVTRPPSIAIATSSFAQSGRASRAASAAGPPEASASAPASAAPSASVSA